MKNLDEILKWIEKLNNETKVCIKRTELEKNNFWFFDRELGRIVNKNNSFFSIAGVKGTVNGVMVSQPILLQNEIGYLGILCKKIKEEVYYLMQAKIEPGNINCVQISPTIQATKSNFTQKHGGQKPHYLDYFLNASQYEIIVDQIQSEQSSRFYGKRNRNIIVLVDDEVEVGKNFCWMTLKDIKKLMHYPNLVNMDTRTVLSCLPYIDKNSYFEVSNSKFRNSLFSSNYINEIKEIYYDINNYKMFTEDYVKIVRLDELCDWSITKTGIVCHYDYPYEVIYCDIEIEGREVKKWTQPLFKANEKALFGLIYSIIDGKMMFLIKISPEIGCFDKVEIGPTIQKDKDNFAIQDNIDQLFKNRMYSREGVVFDTILSEEGGRFYHEENRNIVMEVDYESIGDLPKGYHLVSYATLNHLNLINNCLNIQLRNLLSTLEV